MPRRRKLPDERASITHKFTVAGHEGYVTVGLYEDGRPGEVFIKMSKEGSTLSGVMDTLVLSLSMNLQYGVPIEVIINKLTHTRFEPAGMTANREIPMVKSIMDYLGRWFALKFLTKERAKHFHNADLVDKAYSEGSRSRDAFAMRLPVVDEGERSGGMGMTGDDVEIDAPAPYVTMDTHSEQTVPAHGEASLSPADARLQGFTGSACDGCGGFRMKRNGSCEVCLDCGGTSGCS